MSFIVGQDNIEIWRIFIYFFFEGNFCSGAILNVTLWGCHNARGCPLKTLLAITACNLSSVCHDFGKCYKYSCGSSTIWNVDKRCHAWPPVDGFPADSQSYISVMTTTQNKWVASDRTIANIAGRQRKMNGENLFRRPKKKKDFDEIIAFPRCFFRNGFGVGNRLRRPTTSSVFTFRFFNHSFFFSPTKIIHLSLASIERTLIYGTPWINMSWLAKTILLTEK